MRIIITAFLAALLYNFSYSPSFTQDKEQTSLFSLDVLNFYSTEGTKSRVDIYVSIPMSNMEFKHSKTDKSSYVSKFDLNIDVKDKNGSVIYNNVSKEEITTKETRQEYLTQNSQILTRNLFLPPGEYKVKVSVYEQSTKKQSEKEKNIRVEDFSAEPLSISNVMIVSKLSSLDGKKMITPDVERNVGLVDTFYLFYYVYRNNDDPMIEVNCKILDPERKEVYVKKEIIDASNGIDFQNQVFMGVPTSDLAYGMYTIEISAASGGYSASAKSSFENQNPDFPLALKDIDELIDQLQYIAKGPEIDYMHDGKTETERQKRFLDYWKKQDPSPNTKRNEVMQQYYRRLIIANKLFSTIYTPGWKTDMGMVYIIFGEPSNVERHPYEMDAKPYELWEYYDINRQFVFVDRTGFGDYRLLEPIGDTYRFK